MNHLEIILDVHYSRNSQGQGGEVALTRSASIEKSSRINSSYTTYYGTELEH